jgi:hypothetical protein
MLSQHKYMKLFGGNIGSDLTIHGLYTQNLDVSSKIRNNSLLHAVGIYNFPGGSDGTGPATSNIGNSDAGVDFSHNVTTSTVVSSGGAPTETNMRYVSSSIPNYTALWTNPAVFDISRTISEFLADYQPTTDANGLLLTGGVPRARIQGATGDLDLIDHRRQTISATFWS